jgi:enoyl-CoA hydratase/carnithine racemase
VASGQAHEELAESVVVIEPDDSAGSRAEHGLPFGTLRSIPAVFCCETDHPLADTVASGTGLTDLVDAIGRNPIASIALAMLLRNGENLTIDQGLVAESTTYSMLQAGPEFHAWRTAYVARPRLAEIGPAVQTARNGDVLEITLSRPHVHNAFSARMRDTLAEALGLAACDDSIDRVVLRGAGPSFCSGGDLAEFGSFEDPASAHLTRLTRSPARLMAAVGQRVEVHLHGACMGAGIELPAFAGRVVAHSNATIALPEIALGLVPGAGGTVSIPRRIGRQRMAWLALTGERITAATALEWGLVDEVVDELTDVP